MPPTWAWVLLAIPTIVSLAIGLVIGLQLLVSEMRWRRRVRHHDAQVIDLREHRDGRRWLS